MTLIDLFGMLSNIDGMQGKVCFDSFKEETEMPYIAIVERSSDNFSADNKVYAKSKNIDVELYTERKDEEIEGLLEDQFDLYEIYYETTDNFLDDEYCYQRIYSINI